MKNITLILISILLFVAGVLVMSSSNSDYAAERLLYQAIKINSRIMANPDVAPPEMLSAVENRLKKIVEKYPKTEIADEVQLALAEFYLNNKKYDQARATLEEIIQKYNQDKELLSKAYLLKGASYEQENRWEEALKEYHILRDNYADTPLGLGIPLYLGDYYKKKENYLQADKAYQEAVNFYEKLAGKNKGKPEGYAASTLLLRAYANLKQYEKAGQVVENIINDYPKTLPLIEQLSNVDFIFKNRLNNLQKTKELYIRIKDKIKEPKVIKLLEEKIKALEKN